MLFLRRWSTTLAHLRCKRLYRVVCQSRTKRRSLRPTQRIWHIYWFWKEREIRHSKQKYNDAVSKYNYLLSDFHKYIQKAEDKIKAYNSIYTEGNKKLGATRYKKSVFYKFASEETKAKVELDTLTHRMDQFRNTLDIIKKEHSANHEKTFKDMEY